MNIDQSNQVQQSDTFNNQIQLSSIQNFSFGPIQNMKTLEVTQDIQKQNTINMWSKNKREKSSNRDRLDYSINSTQSNSPPLNSQVSNFAAELRERDGQNRMNPYLSKKENGYSQEEGAFSNQNGKDVLKLINTQKFIQQNNFIPVPPLVSTSLMGALQPNSNLFHPSGETMIHHKINLSREGTTRPKFGQIKRNTQSNNELIETSRRSIDAASEEQGNSDNSFDDKYVVVSQEQLNGLNEESKQISRSDQTADNNPFQHVPKLIDQAVFNFSNQLHGRKFKLSNHSVQRYQDSFQQQKTPNQTYKVNKRTIFSGTNIKKKNNQSTNCSKIPQEIMRIEDEYEVKLPEQVDFQKIGKFKQSKTPQNNFFNIGLNRRDKKQSIQDFRSSNSQSQSKKYIKSKPTSPNQQILQLSRSSILSAYTSKSKQSSEEGSRSERNSQILKIYSPTSDQPFISKARKITQTKKKTTQDIKDQFENLNFGFGNIHKTQQPNNQNQSNTKVKNIMQQMMKGPFSKRDDIKNQTLTNLPSSQQNTCRAQPTPFGKKQKIQLKPLDTYYQHFNQTANNTQRVSKRAEVSNFQDNLSENSCLELDNSSVFVPVSTKNKFQKAENQLSFQSRKEDLVNNILYRDFQLDS